MIDYTFNTHLHNYAVWTAARASQRNFTTTQNIAAAIDASGLRSFAENPTVKDQAAFDQVHVQTAKALIKQFASLGISCTYGRAAKIIAIYLKTSVIVPQRGEGLVCNLIHPPIDRILLQKLKSDGEKPSFKSINWTGLRQDAYFQLIDRLRNHPQKFEPFWSIEVNWQVG